MPTENAVSSAPNNIPSMAVSHKLAAAVVRAPLCFPQPTQAAANKSPGQKTWASGRCRINHPGQNPNLKNSVDNTDIKALPIATRANNRPQGLIWKLLLIIRPNNRQRRFWPPHRQSIISITSGKWVAFAYGYIMGWLSTKLCLHCICYSGSWFSSPWRLATPQ